MSSDDFMEKMNQLKNQYYNDNQKARVFKNSQKLDCAQKIAEQIDLTTVLERTAFIIPNSAAVFLDYSIFKLYANPTTYAAIIDRIFGQFELAIKAYGEYEVHVNLKSITVSSLKRYEEIINMFYARSYSSAIPFSKIVTRLYLYNTPAVMENAASVLKSIIDAEVLTKTTIYGKTDSDWRLDKLAGNMGSTSKRTV